MRSIRSKGIVGDCGQILILSLCSIGNDQSFIPTCPWVRLRAEPRGRGIGGRPGCSERMLAPAATAVIGRSCHETCARVGLRADVAVFLFLFSVGTMRCRGLRVAFGWPHSRRRPRMSCHSAKDGQCSLDVVGDGGDAMRLKRSSASMLGTSRSTGCAGGSKKSSGPGSAATVYGECGGEVSPKRPYRSASPQTLELTTTPTDDALDLANRLIGGLCRKAKHRHAEALQCKGKADNDKARLYAQIGQALTTARETQADPFAAVATLIPWERLASSVCPRSKRRPRWSNRTTSIISSTWPLDLHLMHE